MAKKTHEKRLKQMRKKVKAFWNELLTGDPSMSTEMALTLTAERCTRYFKCREFDHADVADALSYFATDETKA